MLSAAPCERQPGPSRRYGVGGRMVEGAGGNAHGEGLLDGDAHSLSPVGVWALRMGRAG